MNTKKKIGFDFSEVVTVQRGVLGKPEVVSETHATGKIGRGLTIPILHFEDPIPALDIESLTHKHLPDPNVVALQFPIGAQQLFQNSDLPPGVTYEQIQNDLGMTREMLVEHALLAWPHYVKTVEASGGSDEEFYERVVEHFYDDIGQEDARMPMVAHQQALSRHASSLVRMVERVDDRLSDFVGGDLFFRQNAPEAATLVKLTDSRCVVNLIYPSDDPEREMPFFGRDGDPGAMARAYSDMVDADLLERLKSGKYGPSDETLDSFIEKSINDPDFTSASIQLPDGAEATMVKFSDVLMPHRYTSSQPVREFLERWVQEIKTMDPS